MGLSQAGRFTFESDRAEQRAAEMAAGVPEASAEADPGPEAEAPAPDPAPEAPAPAVPRRASGG